MSDYVSMRSIKLKNELMTPAVLQSYRSGNLDTLRDNSSPLQDLYAKTYQYLNYPELSDEDRNLIALTKKQATPPVDNTALAMSIARAAVSK